MYGCCGRLGRATCFYILIAPAGTTYFLWGSNILAPTTQCRESFQELFLCVLSYQLGTEILLYGLACPESVLGQTMGYLILGVVLWFRLIYLQYLVIVHRT